MVEPTRGRGCAGGLRALVIITVLGSTPGCVLFGARFVDSAWESDGVEASLGGGYPIPLMDPDTTDFIIPAVPLLMVFSEDISELSAMAGIACGWKDDGWIGWLGVGPSLVGTNREAEASETEPSETDDDYFYGNHTDMAGAVQLGLAYMIPGPSMDQMGFGIVLQHTFGADLPLPSGTQDLDGWHVYFWVAVPIKPGP